ncbi:MAG TPA: hypothetical protein VJS47_12010 [Rhizomicrobium sp.]|nr:hypothetical protein [Rhizomicrobium sp.]
MKPDETANKRPSDKPSQGQNPVFSAWTVGLACVVVILVALLVLVS